jgi:hypothetical protein
VITGHLAVESDEIFCVLLSGATNAGISRGRGAYTITDDDKSAL